MPAELTDYERIAIIVPRTMKRKLIRIAEETDQSLTRLLKTEIKNYLANYKEKKDDGRKAKAKSGNNDVGATTSRTRN